MSLMTPFLIFSESKCMYKYSGGGLVEVETCSLHSHPIPRLSVAQVLKIHPAMAIINKGIALPAGQ